MRQVSFDFSPGLTQRFPRWRDTLIHAVYSARGGLNAAAAACDVSPTDLTKRLSGEHPDRPLRAEDVERILGETGDPTPIYWLIERFLADPSARKLQALEQLARLAPVFVAIAEQAGVQIPKAKR